MPSNKPPLRFFRATRLDRRLRLRDQRERKLTRDIQAFFGESPAQRSPRPGFDPSVDTSATPSRRHAS